MLNLILDGIVPVVFVIALGYYSGYKQWIDPEGARNFSTFIVRFALPSTLFVGVFNFTPKQLADGPYVLVMVLGIMLVFGVAVVIGRLVFRLRLDEAGLFGCNCGFPDMAYFGLPILTSVVGVQGLLPVIVGNLVTSVLMVPMIVFFLHHGASPAGADSSRQSFLANVLSTFKQPVVLAPILGLVLVLGGFHLPVLVKMPLQVIGNTTGGVALFTLGVLISALKFRVDKASLVVVLLKNIAMPALVLGLGWRMRLDTQLVKGLVLATACPAATLGAIFSATFKVGQKTIPAEVLCSNLFGVVSMGFWTWVAERL